MSNRRGISLVEMMSVMVASSALAGLSAAMLVVMLQTDRNLAQQRDDQRQLSAFADAFRSDAHAALACEWNGPRRRLTFTNPGGGRAVYFFREDRVERRAQMPEGQDDLLTGVFALPPTGDLQVEPAEAAGGELVRLRLVTSKNPVRKQMAGGLFNVTAQIGRDERLLAP